MNCEEITQTAVALEIVQAPEDSRLQQLFHCIYTLFHGSFLAWILHKYPHSRYKDKLLEDAKDAFQNGLMAFYRKSRDKAFTIKGSLKTTIYSFGFLQLLAFFKKEKHVYHEADYEAGLRHFFEDDFFESERQQLLNEQELQLMRALYSLPEKKREILIRRFFEGQKSKQIAGTLHVTAGNVDNDAVKAYKQLRALLSPKSVTQKGEEWN